MLRFALGLLAAAWMVQQLAALPGMDLLAGVILVLAALARLTRRPCVAGACLGVAWAGLFAHWHQPAAIPDLTSTATYQASGVVRSLPAYVAGQARMQFAVDRLARDGILFTHFYKTYDH